MFKKSSSFVSLTAIILSMGAAAPAFAASGNCQHPYCSMSAGYDAEHGITGSVPDGQEVTDFETLTSSNYKPGKVRHIVLFRYASGVTPAQKEEVKRRFLALKELGRKNGRRYIRSIETGAETSHEGADQGLEQGFIVTFASEGDRNYYVGKPFVTEPAFYDGAHEAFKAFVGPLLDAGGAVVFDF